MYIAIILLKQEKLLSRIATFLIECGLYESSILDGEGIENVADQSSPLLKQVLGLFGRELIYNRTIIVHIPEKAMLETFLGLCRSEGIDFTRPDIGAVMAFPCEIYIGPEE